MAEEKLAGDKLAEDKKKALITRLLWVASLLSVIAGSVMLMKGNSAGGAVFLATGSFWMIMAIAQGKKKA